MQQSLFKLLRQQRQRGDLAPLPRGGGAQAKLNEDHLMILTELVAESPDAELEALREQMKKKTKVEVSISTISRALKALGLSRKKNETRQRGQSGRAGGVRKEAKKTAR